MKHIVGFIITYSFISPLYGMMKPTLKHLDKDLYTYVQLKEKDSKDPKIKAFEQLLTKDDINAQDEAGNTRLHYAAYVGQPILMKELIKLGADPSIINRKDNSPLNVLQVIQENIKDADPDWAIKNNMFEEFKAFLKTRPDLRFKDQMSYLHAAVKQENIPLVEELLAQKWNPNEPDMWGNTPLHTALTSIKSGASLIIAKNLLNAGAKPDIPNSQKDTPLHMLITYYVTNVNKNSAEFNKLLEETIFISAARASTLNMQDARGNTPLYILVAGLKDTGERSNVARLLQRLFVYGANPNIKNKDGFTPLHAAIMQGNVGAVKLLLQAHADPFATTYKPRTLQEIHAKKEPVPDQNALELAEAYMLVPDMPLDNMLNIIRLIKAAMKLRQPQQVPLDQPAAGAALINALQDLSNKLQRINFR